MSPNPKTTEAFAELLERLTVSEEMMGWIRDGMREVDADRQNRHLQRE